MDGTHSALGRPQSAAKRHGTNVPCGLSTNVEEPSVLVIWPLHPGQSRVRLPGKSCCAALFDRQRAVGPKPWPTTLMAMVAMPLCASVEGTANGAPCLLSVNPWPKWPPASRAGPRSCGINRLKTALRLPVPERFFTRGNLGNEYAGILPLLSTELAEWQWLLMEPGKPAKLPAPNSGLVGTSGPTVRACTLNVRPVTELKGNTVFSPACTKVEIDQRCRGGP